MPLYEYKCERCGHRDYEIRTIDNRNEPRKCQQPPEELTTMSVNNCEIRCGGEMKFVEIPKSISIRPNGIEKE